MFIICIEASHQRGLGHLYRALTLYKSLKSLKKDVLIFINQDPKSLETLKAAEVLFDTYSMPLKLTDIESLIGKNNISTWINDRLHTSLEQAQLLNKKGLQHFTFDDLGTGAKFANCNFLGLHPSKTKSNNQKTGLQYLLLNDEVPLYRKLRFLHKGTTPKILVTLGGADTYGATLKVLKICHEKQIFPTVITGPSFEHFEGLKKLLHNNDNWIHSPSSLIEHINQHDLIISGGGMTCVESVALGIPTLVVANEKHEIPTALLLESLKVSHFLGFHEDLTQFNLPTTDQLNNMSHFAITNIPITGKQNVLKLLTE
jgi:spore coat polysaccharide biosynthesis predicted glycosyltransferase SpsG